MAMVNRVASTSKGYAATRMQTDAHRQVRARASRVPVRPGLWALVWHYKSAGKPLPVHRWGPRRCRAPSRRRLQLRAPATCCPP